MRRGKALEELMHALYSIEASTQGASTVIESIECPGFVRDLDNDGQREFDVLVTGKLGKLPFSAAIECKDWGRPVDTPVVEGFYQKCVGTSIPLRMLVASEGFTEPALAKAKKLGIQCRSLSEIAGVDWLQMEHLHTRHRNAHKFSLYCQTELDVPQGMAWHMIDSEGNAVTNDMQKDVANLAFSHVADEGEPDGNHTVKVGVRDLNWRARLEDASTVEIKLVVVTMHYEVTTELSPFTVYEESVHDGSEAIVHAFAASSAVGKLVISEQPDGSKSVHIVRA